MRASVVLATVATIAVAVASAGSAAGGMAGKYTATIKSPAQIKGTWRLNLKPGGAYVVSLNGESLAAGTWSATPTTITFREPDGCRGTGTYGWKKTKAVVRFTPRREDPRCQVRRAVLAHPFVEAR
jgi:hypothetical protein